ncbi:hypothetical protein [Sphingomonas bacterium]|uniref:hypothetical protein n=1 Tax=Sphingomonas bacterium TaxID=1895847 RepID=UPI00260B5592|nr:hypothetical protein [Sphingomonas bacterium]MDB5677084.1 hypothetical protein [Sphingomonas bacterium]
MIALFALLAIGQTAATDPPPPDPSNDIIVRSIRKLDDWRAVLIFQDDTPTCRVVKSTGDAAIDAVGCATMVQCFVTTKPQFAALNNRALSASKRRSMRLAANRAMEECFKTTRRTMMVDLTNRRSALESKDRDR